jgi:GNAT superfamily N-acetyltransferase
MRSPSELKPAPLPPQAIRIERMPECPPSFWRYPYAEVGREYLWVDRLPWTPDQIRTHLADPAVSVWLLTVSGAPAGYFELRRDAEEGVEIAYFGLLGEFHGRGLGGYLLTEAVGNAWRLGATRVWLHTNSLDHPAALPNYLKRGFKVYRTEEYEVEI